jgi:SbsC C-terminal domain/Bacterial Ig-like domain (group 2)/Bacterial Ig-like domain (group 4)
MKKSLIAMLVAVMMVGQLVIPASYKTADAATYSEVLNYLEQAESWAGALKWQTSVEHTGVVKYPDMKIFNKTKENYLKVLQLKGSLSSSKRLEVERRLTANVEVYYYRAMAYIDAITSGEKIIDKTNKFNDLYKVSPISNETEIAYHDLSFEIRKQAILLYRVYGKSTRDAILVKFKTPGESATTASKYVITAKMVVDQLEELIEIGASSTEIQDQVAKVEEALAFVEDETLVKALKDRTTVLIKGELQVDTFAPIMVNYGAKLQDLNLPKEVKVTYIDESTETLEVTWDTSKLDLNTPGEYLLNGNIKDITSKATIKVIVNNVEVSSIDNIIVNKGIKIENVNFPKEVKVTYGDGKSEQLPVTWGQSSLDLNTPGEYSITGTFTKIPSKATVKVIVKDVTIEKLNDVTVFSGISANDLNLPSEVNASYYDGSVNKLNVTWDLTPLNLNTVGEYTLTGTITDTTLTTSIRVIVQKEFPDSVTINRASATIKENASVQLSATVTPSTTIKKNITWTTSDNLVATVDQTGKVTGIREGTAVITVTTENGITATTNITVSNQPNLYVNAYASMVINGVIKGISMNVQNLDSEKVTVEKIEIYERNTLYTTYTKENLETNGIATEISPGQPWGMSVSLKFGIWEDNSYVKFYLNSNGKTYEYRRDL